MVTLGRGFQSLSATSFTRLDQSNYLTRGQDVWGLNLPIILKILRFSGAIWPVVRRPVVKQLVQWSRCLRCGHAYLTYCACLAGWFGSYQVFTSYDRDSNCVGLSLAYAPPQIHNLLTEKLTTTTTLTKCLSPTCQRLIRCRRCVIWSRQQASLRLGQSQHAYGLGLGRPIHSGISRTVGLCQSPSQLENATIISLSLPTFSKLVA